MSKDKAGTENLNQKQASRPIRNENDKQINPSVKFNPRQETTEKSNQDELSSRTATTKTVEDAPTVDSTKGGL